MGQNKISTIVTANTSDFNAKMKQANQVMKVTQSELRASSSAMKAMGNDTTTLANHQQKLNTQIVNVKDKMALYSTNIEKNSTKLTENQNKITQLSAKKDSLNKKIQEAIQKYGEESKEVSDLRNELSDVESEYSKTERAIVRNTNAINKSKVGYNDCQREVNNLETELRQTERALQEQNNKALQLSKSMATLGSKMQTVGGNLNTLGTGLVALGAPIVALGGFSIKAASEFQHSMQNVKAISGATGEDFELLKNKALEMGKSTSKSASECSQALSYMALAGWDTQESLAGLEPILRLSEASGSDLARTSDLVTDSLSSLALTAQDANGYLDMLAQAQRKSNTSADQLAEAYIVCGGTVKNLNIPLQEATTYLGGLANQGLKGSEAGRSLNSVLINLTSGLGQAGDAMTALGLTAFDNTGKFKGLDVVLTELDKALENCTEEQRNQYLAMIGGKTQIDTLNKLLSTNKNEYKDLSKEIGNCDGALNEMAETMMDSTTGNIIKFKSQLEGLGIQIGTNLLPHVNKFIEVLSSLVNRFGELSPSTQSFIMQLGLWSTVGGVALKMTGSLVSGVGSLLSILSPLVAKMGLTTTATTAMTTATTTAVTATTGMATATATTGGALALLSNPLVLVTGGFLALALGIGNAMLESGKFNRELGGVNARIGECDEELSKLAGRKVDIEVSTEFANEIKSAIEEANAEIDKFQAQRLNGNKKFNKEELETNIKHLKEDQKNFVDNKKETDKLLEEATKTMTEGQRETWSKAYEEQATDYETSCKRMIELQQKAIEEKRPLNDQELLELETLRQKMRDVETTFLADNNLDLMSSLQANSILKKTYSDEDIARIENEQNKIREARTITKNAHQQEMLELETLRNNDQISQDEYVRKVSESLANKVVNMTTATDNEVKLWQRLMKEKEGDLAFQELAKKKIETLEQQKRTDLALTAGEYKKLGLSTKEMATTTGLSLNECETAMSDWDRIVQGTFSKTDRKYAETGQSAQDMANKANPALGGMKGKTDDLGKAINGLPSYKGITIEQKYKTTGTKTYDKHSGFALGTSYVPESAFATINESGWELIDAPISSKNDIAYLEQGTQVSTHSQSREQMLRDIDSAVERNLNSKTSNLREIKDNNTTSDSNQILNFYNTYNVDAANDFKAEKLASDVVKHIEDKARRFGVNLKPVAKVRVKN